MIKPKYAIYRNNPDSALEFLCDTYDALHRIDPSDDLLKYLDSAAYGDVAFSRKHKTEFMDVFGHGAKSLGLTDDKHEFMAMICYGTKMYSRVCELLDVTGLVKDLVIDFGD